MSYASWNDANVELCSRPAELQTDTGFSSLRPSLDGWQYESQHCDVYVHDNNATEEESLAGAVTSTCYAIRDVDSSTRLRKRLAVWSFLWRLINTYCRLRKETPPGLVGSTLSVGLGLWSMRSLRFILVTVLA